MVVVVVVVEVRVIVVVAMIKVIKEVIENSGGDSSSRGSGRE